ncbi:ParB-like nuclease [Lachnospiraceae bacterium JC7]|nr:ParB-like nuclease [Lachnospiraceae bacterium JC7]
MAEEILTIGNVDYTVRLDDLNQADLKFYPENPRVYTTLNMDGEPSQEDIEEYMCNQDHVKQLKVSIKSNGGLIDPVIVRDGDFVVLEGNSRLAAYRLLNAEDPIKWGMIKCKILPGDISDSAIFTLLGQYHIVGRKDWDPYEQANYLYRRQQQTRLPIDAMADELGITRARAKKMIEVISFMIQHDDLNKRHWSHYEEYLKNAGVKKYRETDPDIDDVIAEKVKSEEINEASDMRKLGDIAKLNDKQAKKVMKKIVNGESSLYDGYEEIKDAGKLDDVVKKLKTFRTYINDDTIEAQMKATPETYKRAQFELEKIIKRLEKLAGK